MKLLRNLFKQKHHWYQVKIFYKNKNNVLVADFKTDIGLVHQKDILNRTVLREFGPLHKNKQIPKSCLCNGRMYFEVLSYLGYFAQ